jgi:uncharacterized protein (TIGR03437 family)
MNLRRILIPAVVSLTMLAMVAEARYVFVLPPSGSINPIMVGYNENLQPIGSVAVPAGANQVLTSASGDKAIIISQNGAAGVSFVNVVGGQLSGAVRPLSLDSQIPSAAALLSPDGTKVIVVAGSGPATLYVIDVATETFTTNGKTLIGGSPRDMVVSQDSRYAYLLGPGLLTMVELSTGSVLAQTGIAGQAANSVVNISLSPTGSLFVTSAYMVIEFDSRPPFLEKGRSQTIVHPGKLSFSPDGRYGVTTNELFAGSSVVVLDMQLIGAQPATDPRISVAPITQGGSTALRTEKVQVLSETTALAFVPSVQKMYLLQYPALVVSDINLGGAGVPANVTGYSLSNEFPKVRYLFYNSAGQLFKHDLLTNQSLGSVAGGLSGVAFAAVPSIGPAVQTVPYNNGQTVGPIASAKPYVVRVLDGNGRPVYNSPIAFSSDTAGVLLTNASATTSVDGYASVTATSPAANGAFVVKAQVGALTTTFTSTVVGGTGGGGGGNPGGEVPTSKLTLISGDGQLIQSGFPSSIPLVVKMTATDGTPLAGRTITWTSTPGIQFIGGNTTTVTDGNGLSSMLAYPLTDFSAGVGFVSSSITASSDVGTVSFTMTSYPFQTGPFSAQPTIVLNKPLQQDKQMTAKLGVKQDGAIQVIVVTSGGVGISPGQPIPGIGVSVTTGITDPKLGPVAKCEGGTVLTGADGIANCNLIVEGLTGTSQLTVDVGGARNFPDLRLTVTPGDPGVPVIVQGNNQTGKPGAQLPLALSARISDGFGNLLPGTPVAWEIVTANSVRLFNTINAADSNGMVSTLVQLGPTPGKYDIKVTAAGKVAVFSVTVETVATGFTKVSGDGQPVTPINQAFAQPLVVKVNDAQGAAVAGVTVTWSVSGSATLSGLTTTTAADGTARVTVTAGSVAGAITVTASTTGLPNLSFSLQSRLPGPSIVAGSFANWASAEAGVTPGGLVLITGTGLAPNTQGSTNANLLAGKLPFELAGVTVEFQFTGGSAFAPIYRVSNINGTETVLAQVPFEVTGASVSAVVNVSGGTTTVTGIPVKAISPGVIEDFISGRQAAVVIRSDGLTVTPATPARRGELVRMYAIGLGQTSPAAQTNRVGVPDQLTLAKITIGIDNKGFQALSSYMAENLIGVYEIVFRIPEDAIVGNDRPLGFLVESNGQSVFANGSVISVSQ